MPRYIQNINARNIYTESGLTLLRTLPINGKEHPNRENKTSIDGFSRCRQDLDKVLELGDIQGVVEFLKPRLGERVVNEAFRNLPKTKTGYAPLAVTVTPSKPYAR